MNNLIVNLYDKKMKYVIFSILKRQLGKTETICKCFNLILGKDKNNN